ncbi:hypothetical protein FKM82_016799 [Ascaphus truei]
MPVGGREICMRGGRSFQRTACKLSQPTYSRQMLGLVCSCIRAAWCTRGRARDNLTQRWPTPPCLLAGSLDFNGCSLCHWLNELSITATSFLFAEPMAES